MSKTSGTLLVPLALVLLVMAAGCRTSPEVVRTTTGESGVSQPGFPG